MGIHERKQKNKEELKALILSSACHIISTEGLEHLSMRKIATLIDYTPTTIYKYFKNKEELISAIISETTKDISQAMKVLESKKLSPVGYFLEGFELYIHKMLEKPEHFKAVIMSNLVSDAEIRVFAPGTSFNPAVLDISHCITEGIRIGWFRESDVEMTTRFIWISVYGLISRLIIESELPEKERAIIIGDYLEFLLKTLKK